MVGNKTAKSNGENFDSSFVNVDVFLFLFSCMTSLGTRHLRASSFALGHFECALVNSSFLRSDF